MGGRGSRPRPWGCRPSPGSRRYRAPGRSDARRGQQDDVGAQLDDLLGGESTLRQSADHGDLVDCWERLAVLREGVEVRRLEVVGPAHDPPQRVIPVQQGREVQQAPLAQEDAFYGLPDLDLTSRDRLRPDGAPAPERLSRSWSRWTTTDAGGFPPSSSRQGSEEVAQRAFHSPHTRGVTPRKPEFVAELEAGRRGRDTFHVVKGPTYGIERSSSHQDVRGEVRLGLLKAGLALPVGQIQVTTLLAASSGLISRKASNARTNSPTMSSPRLPRLRTNTRP